MYQDILAAGEAGSSLLASCLDSTESKIKNLQNRYQAFVSKYQTLPCYANANVSNALNPGL